MNSDGGGDVSTIFVGGFPPDASSRELDNLCRFLPGFVTSKVVTTKGLTLFALFDCPLNAVEAINVLDGQPFDGTQVGGEPMRAQMARTNMRGGGGGGVGLPNGFRPPAPQPTWDTAAIMPNQPPPPEAPYPGPVGVPIGKRPRMAEEPGAVDTVASLGAKEAGIDETSLKSFFESLPGFVDFKGNPRMGGGFAKFASSAMAQQAVEMAQQEGVPAEMARSSMASNRDGSGGWPGPAPVITPAAAFQPPRAPVGGGHGFDAKRARIYEDPNQVDTIACVGALEAGFDEPALMQFFEQTNGFVAFKANPRMGGGFVKFLASDLAQLALQAAQDAGIPAALARSSMATH